MTDFEHLDSDLQILTPYLEAACAEARRGVNVLIHGRPGTGKTQLVRALAAHLGMTLFEVAADGASGKPRVGRERFECYRFAQCLLEGSQRHALLFDEVEDVFAETVGDPWARRSSGNVSGTKAWVNQMLEGNAIPAFWITNHLDSVDPAYRRRFDYVMHLDIPPLAVRRRLIGRCTAEVALAPEWLEQAARHEALAPALVTRAVRVGAAAQRADSTLEIELAVSRALNNTLDALGAPRLAEAKGDAAALSYSLDFLQADADLDRLSKGLRQSGEGRLCLCGPPGTGKTAFAAHLAGVLERPMLVRRASDILGPYVGESERNIARMFAQATDERAVLVFDEADSLLRDRRHAQRSWEVTQVNEMLTRMECFGGIFVASTNLVESLDAAALRRFDAHIHLGYLRPPQAWAMFLQLCQKCFRSAAPEELMARVQSLTVLTPGDFAALARRARFDPPADPVELLQRLEQLCSAKQEAPSRRIGFVA